MLSATTGYEDFTIVEYARNACDACQLEDWHGADDFLGSIQDSWLATHGRQCEQSQTPSAQSQVECNPEDLRREIQLAREAEHETKKRRALAKQQHMFAAEQLKSLERLASGLDTDEIAGQAAGDRGDFLKFDNDARSDCSDASSDVPSCVETYFELAAQAYVIHERLVELDCDLREAKAICEAVERSHGGPQYSERSYRKRRQELVQDLVIAHYRRDDMRDVCFRQGFDPENFRFRDIF